MRVIWPTDAEDQLEEIFEFESQKDPAYAADVYNTIIEEADKLAALPEMASKELSLEDVPGEYRSLIIQSRYKVIYRFYPDAEEIMVASVWDCRQDPETLKKKATKKK